MNYLIPFLILITVVVFIHEYGHYYFAKRYGVGVTDFSIGFGKEIFGWNDKSGTRWKFCLIPLGGYVKFFGDRNVFSQAEQEELLKKYSKEDQNKLFVTKPLYQRSLVVAAGPLANFALAILIFSFIYMFAGKDFTPAQIQEVQKDGPAYSSGIKTGDIIPLIKNCELLITFDLSTTILEAQILKKPVLSISLRDYGFGKSKIFLRDTCKTLPFSKSLDEIKMILSKNYNQIQF